VLAHVEKVLSPERLALVASNGHAKEGGLNTRVSAAAPRRATYTRKEARP
jgi:hypothetical protein